MGRPGVLQSMGSQRVGGRLNYTERSDLSVSPNVIKLGNNTSNSNSCLWLFLFAQCLLLGFPDSSVQPVTLKKLKLNGSMKTYKTF